MIIFKPLNVKKYDYIIDFSIMFFQLGTLLAVKNYIIK